MAHTNMSLSNISSAAQTSVGRIESLLQSDGRVGFAAATDGGGTGATLIKVTSLSDAGAGTLRDALEQTGPRWIYFDDSLANSTINLASALPPYLNGPGNFCIDGRGAGGVGLNIKLDASDPGVTHVMNTFSADGNFILHGIGIDGGNSAHGPTGLQLRWRDNIWLDHITAERFSADDAFSLGIEVDPNHGKKFTLSNIRTRDTNKSILSGGTEPLPGNIAQTTVYKCVLDSNERTPLVMRQQQMHMVNTVVVANRPAVARRAGILYSQNNFYETTGKAIDKGIWEVGQPNGIIYSSGDFFENGGTTDALDGSIWSGVTYSLPNILPGDASSKALVMASAGSDSGYTIPFSGT